MRLKPTSSLEGVTLVREKVWHQEVGSIGEGMDVEGVNRVRLEVQHQEVYSIGERKGVE